MTTGSRLLSVDSVAHPQSGSPAGRRAFPRVRYCNRVSWKSTAGKSTKHLTSRSLDLAAAGTADGYMDVVGRHTFKCVGPKAEQAVANFK